VVTVHDLLYFPTPGVTYQEYPTADNLYMRTMIPPSVRQATRVACDSQHTLDDIRRVIPSVAPEKMSVIPLAAPKHFRVMSGDQVDGLLRPLDLQRPYFVYSATLSPRKNQRTLLKAFGRIKDQIPHSLVLTGSGTAVKEQFADLIESEGLQGRVQTVGYVEEDQLSALMNGAEALLFPSSYEGFGIPPLEAFACNCPVICSNATSLPEVVGDAALTHDPYDVAALAEHMICLVNKPGLRKKLIEKGRARVKMFSWERSSRMLVKLLVQSAEAGIPHG